MTLQSTNTFTYQTTLATSLYSTEPLTLQLRTSQILAKALKGTSLVSMGSWLTGRPLYNALLPNRPPKLNCLPYHLPDQKWWNGVDYLTMYPLEQTRLQFCGVITSKQLGLRLTRWTDFPPSSNMLISISYKSRKRLLVEEPTSNGCPLTPCLLTEVAS